MKSVLIIASVALLSSGCRRQLNVVHSDPNWYPSTAHKYVGPAIIEVQLTNGHNKPLEGHRIHVDEVKLRPLKEDTNSAILGWLSVQRDKDGHVELITDYRGRVTVAFETPSTFPNDIAVKHWLRFSHTGKRKEHKTDPRVACIVPVALCNGAGQQDILPCFSDQ